MASGRVITRLGRDGDLIVGGANVSRVHIAFEVHPITLAVLLSVRSTLPHAGVQVQPTERDEPEGKAQTVGEKRSLEALAVYGDCVIVYNQDYQITFSSLIFQLV
jgi:hypothetical protein